jgi:hypothetical protein
MNTPSHDPRKRQETPNSPLPTDAGPIDSGAMSGADISVTNTDQPQADAGVPSQHQSPGLGLRGGSDSGMSTLMDLVEAQGALSDVTISGNIDKLDDSTGDVEGDGVPDFMDPNDISPNT